MSDIPQNFSGVDVIIERMKQFPQEFFESGVERGERGRWSFIYKDYFRDAMTESEKGRILEQLKVVRRIEFDALVLKELFKEEKREPEQMELPLDQAGLKYNTRDRYKV